MDLNAAKRREIRNGSRRREAKRSEICVVHSNSCFGRPTRGDNCKKSSRLWLSPQFNDRSRSESTLANQDDRNCEHSSTNNKSRKAFDGYLRDEKSVNKEVNQKQGVDAVHCKRAVASPQVSVWGQEPGTSYAVPVWEEIERTVSDSGDTPELCGPTNAPLPDGAPFVKTLPIVHHG